MNPSEIKEHMEVVGTDGKHVGTVDHLDGDRLKLTRTTRRRAASTTSCPSPPLCPSASS